MVRRRRHPDDRGMDQDAAALSTAVPASGRGVRRRALLAALTLAPALAACGWLRPGGPPGQSAGTCPGATASQTTLPAPPPPDAQETLITAWQSGAHQLWRTDTGLSAGRTSFTDRYLRREQEPGSTRVLGGPRMVHESDEQLVLADGAAVACLDPRDGALLWTVELREREPGIGGVSGSLLWTTAGVIDLADGGLRLLPEAVEGASSLAVEPGAVYARIGRQLVAVDLARCVVSWCTDLDIDGEVRLHGEDGLMVGFFNNQTYARRDGARRGRVEFNWEPPSDPQGVYPVVAWVASDDGGVERIVLDDERGGDTARLRCVLPDADDDRYIVRDWDPARLRDNESRWEVPVPVRSGVGAVVAMRSDPSAVGERSVGDAVWVLDLDEDGQLHVARWEAGP